MTRRRGGGLTPDEHDLWRKVAQTAQPLHPFRFPAVLEPVPDAPAKPPPRAPIAPFTIGATATSASHRHDLVSSLGGQPPQTPLRMDHKAFDRMRRGKLSPEGRLDLHGMTLAEAHPALRSFVVDAYHDAKRLVLVITGKGRRGEDHGPIPQRMGVLKHQVPQWLAMPPLGALVLQVAEAHLKHGGAGAYYVYLRRTR